MSNKLKDLGIRALKTFIQSTLAILVASGLGYIHLASLKSAVIGGGAAVLSFLNNAIPAAETNSTTSNPGVEKS